MKLEKGKTIHLIFGSSIFSIQKKQMKFKRIRKFFSFFPVYVYLMWVEWTSIGSLMSDRLLYVVPFL